MQKTVWSAESKQGRNGSSSLTCSTVWRFGPGLRRRNRAHSGRLGGLSFKWLGLGSKSPEQSNQTRTILFSRARSIFRFFRLKSLKPKRKRAADRCTSPCHVRSDNPFLNRNTNSKASKLYNSAGRNLHTHEVLQPYYCTEDQTN